VRAVGHVGLRNPRLRFVVSSWRRGGHWFDLDNLVDPVLAVVGAPVAERRSVWATVETGEQPGVAISERPPPPTPPHATKVHVAAPPRRSVRTADRLVELIHVAQLGSDEPCGYTLTLGTDTGGLIFGFDGPIKPTVDALWPLLGGTSHAPADHRVRELRVLVDPSATGISATLWLLDSERRG
jgi:hypothetical protein